MYVPSKLRVAVQDILARWHTNFFKLRTKLFQEKGGGGNPILLCDLRKADAARFYTTSMH